jgi:hypothetical protein
MSTASMRIVLNGQLGEKIWHRWGLRQGDPLSPMLFILVMDVLNCLLGTARDHELVQPTRTSGGEVLV